MLSESVRNVKGVGDKMAQDLYDLGIQTAEDLLFYFPSRYEVFEVKRIGELIHDEKATIEGTVISDPRLSFYGKKRSRLMFNIKIEQVIVKIVMFNRAFAKQQIKVGDELTLTGKWDAHRLQMTVSQYRKGVANAQANIQVVYSTKGNVTLGRFRKIIFNAMEQYASEIPEILPESYLTAYKLPTRVNALKAMHYPKNRVVLKHARRRFIYEEFLVFQLRMQLLKKKNREATTGNQQLFQPGKLQTFIEQLPFNLTEPQHKSLKQILADMKSPFKMNRLLQGDVGSGKTIVAAICLYATVTAGKQGALMVPTEILAEQHFQSLQALFSNTVHIALLTGSVKGNKRLDILKEVEDGEVDIVIGTHALIQEDVIFHDLGLVVIDEQHRFGVEQRRILRDKGLHPDGLFMTATPIPRTLAITSFGDMDVSVIDQLPSGRKTIETYWMKKNMFERLLTFIQKKIAMGEQAFIICPLIEESDKLDIQNAIDLYEQLVDFYPSEINVGLMHSRLNTNEKEQVMKSFVQNDMQILVSTTVVEVGVNIPNATIMAIYDAERFGLSQLHQLRGRVGRGALQSYCFLIAEPKGEIGKERMKIMAETSDGFELAEQDLQLRGPGDFFGKKQSGLPEFKVADMVHDYRALETARKDAEEIIANHLLEEDPSYQQMKVYLEDEGNETSQLD